MEQPAPGPAPQAEPTVQTAPSVPMLPAVGAPVPSSAPETPERTTPFGPSEGVPQVSSPLPNFQSRWQSGESGEGLTPRPSSWDSFLSGAQKGIHDTGLGLLYRMGERSAQPDGKQLSPADANKLYPGRPVPYTTPVNENIARLEYNDRQKQQQLDDWVARGNHGAANWTGNLVGSLTDPMALTLGVLSGGLSELALPVGAPFAARAAAHFMGTYGAFVGTGAVENLAEHQMGAKSKQLSQIAGESLVPAALMSGIGMGLSALARRFLNETGGAVDPAMVRKTVAALEQDQKIPSFEPEREVLAARRAGAQVTGPSSEKVTPTLQTSPIQDTKLYGATHADGSPLIHEHGLGPGRQFTDAYDVANNGVSRASEVPGQIGETRLPSRETKLLDLDQSASGSKEFLKALEDKTGLSFEQVAKEGGSLKDILNKISDVAGTHDVPENIMEQVQAIAKEQGYKGYQMTGKTAEGIPTNRQVHMFDASGMALEDSYHATPATTPSMPTPSDLNPTMTEAQPAQTGNPALSKAQEFSYSPQIERLVHEFRKGKTFEPFSPEALTDLQKDIDQYKQQLTDLSENSPSAEASLQELKKQEVQDTRLRDIVKRIIECGAGGGV